ncbi:MAG: hypothetical protein Q8P24_12525 [Desulfobacterales bacterium]|nr:hypothetical protein [Desulfobacterales bacterium]
MADKRLSTAGLSREEKRKLWIEISDLTEEEFDEMQAAHNARQVRVPRAGSQAPDFELDVLDRSRLRAGDTVRLSSLRGKPVAMIFGSYT